MTKKISIDQLTINSIRMLGIQSINSAKSGHPGIVLGAATMMYTLFKDHLKFNPKNPAWFNRDRFILSAGHGSALLYSMLYHSGYNYSLQDLKNFRKLDSVTPGHPEYDLALGVEVATGPLGQGIANAVGMALVESFLSAKFNKSDINLIDHNTYVICGDGDLQEGVAQEALSFAGHFKLNKLIILYDSNDVQLDSKTNLVISENAEKRFKSLQWNYIKVTDGNDYQAISAAISQAKKSDKPTLIEIKTIIGYGASKQGTSAVHGAALMDDIKVVSKYLDWSYQDFFVPDDVVENFQAKKINLGINLELEWNKKLKKYQEKYQDLYQEIADSLNGKVFSHNIDVEKIDWSSLTSDKKAIATRISSGDVLKILSEVCPTLIGGSADLAGSTKALVNDVDYDSKNPAGRHIRYGVREFAMAAMVNGMVLHQGVIPFGSTFLVFSDYMKPALRLAALMKIPSIFIFSHDSVAVGEDGPTHEPVEQLAMLRTIPNFNVIRPADSNETIGAYKIALKSKNTPSAIVLSRQDLPQLTNSNIDNVNLGGYIISQKISSAKLDLILVATGSETHLAIEVQKLLWDNDKINSQVVSMPATYLFDKQSCEYKKSILIPNVTKVAIEAAVSDSWYKYVGLTGLIIGIDEFGASGEGHAVLAKYGFSTEKIYQKIINFIKK